MRKNQDRCGEAVKENSGISDIQIFTGTENPSVDFSLLRRKAISLLLILFGFSAFLSSEFHMQAQASTPEESRSESVDTLAASTVLYVSPQGDDSTGKDWAHAFKTIANALLVMQLGEGSYEIHIAAGTYREGRDLVLPDRASLIGGWSGNGDERDVATYKSIIDAEKARRCIKNSGVLDGLYFQNGSVTNDNGGGVLNLSTGIVTNCTFTACSAEYGGGLYNDGGSISNCTLRANSAGAGGGIDNCNSGTVTSCTLVSNSGEQGAGAYNNENCLISGCKITGNVGGDGVFRGGGGVRNRGTMENCMIEGNSAKGSGGGVLIDGGIMRNCTVVGNSAEGGGGGISSTHATIESCRISKNSTKNSGGGVYAFGGKITNCVVIGNSAEIDGGGIQNDYSGGSLTNCTIIGNYSKGFGGGVYNAGSITNSIVWRNNISDISGNLSNVSYSCFVEAAKTADDSHNLRVNPQFVSSAGTDLLSWDLRLKDGSPCIDNGFVAAQNLPATDLSGSPRVGGDKLVDMGAYEGADAYVPGVPASARVLYVSAQGDGSTGMDWTHAIKTLRAALAVVLADDNFFEIRMAGGTYREGQEIRLPGRVSLVGGWLGKDSNPNARDVAGNKTVIDGEKANRCIYNYGLIDGLWIQNGSVHGSGGGVFNDFTGTMTNCTMTGNSASDDGGGGFNDGGKVNDCMFVGNTTSNAGGGLCNRGNVNVSNCSFTGNSGSYGGGIYNRDGGTVENCVITSNFVSVAGGGVCSYGGKVTGCMLQGNSATRNGGGDGGGIYIADSAIATNCIVSGNTSKSSGGGIALSYATVVNCIITGNSTEGSGGGIGNYRGTVTNCTIAGNSATSDSGGISNSSYGTVTNCIAWGNIASDMGGDLSGVTYCNFVEATGENHNLWANPKFVSMTGDDPSAWDLSLQSDSLCIDSGTMAVSNLPTTDILGIPRPQGKGIDRGAYEFTNTFQVVVIADPSNGGMVSKSPDLVLYENGTEVTLTATAAEGYTFTGWYEGATKVSAENSFTYTVAGASKKFTAKFGLNLPKYAITVAADPIEGGTVSKSPDQETYDSGSQVTLTATAADGYTFSGWYDGATKVSSNASYTYTVAADKTFTAKFTQVPTYSVSVAADPVEGGTVSKAPDQATYASGTKVVLTAIAADGYTFTGWYSGTNKVSSNVSYTYTVAADKTFTAKFKSAQPDQFFVTVMVDPVGGGSVSKSPDQATYGSGSQVVLTAEAAEGYTFNGWYDGATKVSSNVSYTYTVTADKTFTAKFESVEPDQFSITVVADPAEGGTVSKSPDQATYTSGEQVVLTAVPMDHYLFLGWYEGTMRISSNASYTYTVVANKTFTAKFTRDNLPAPQNVTAENKTYWALLTWQAVNGATGYRITRTVGDQVVTWDTNAETRFADDTVTPGIEYSYQVTAMNALGTLGTESEMVSVSVSAETFRRSAYKVTARGYSMTRDLSNNLYFTGESAGTIKIMLLKSLPKNVEDDESKGIYYFQNLDVVPEFLVSGDVKTLAIDVPVNFLKVTGMVNTLQAKNPITSIQVGEIGKVKLSATRPMESRQYAHTTILTGGSAPLTLQATGVVVETLDSYGELEQAVQLFSVASKSYKNEVGLNKTSLGAVGALPKAVAEATGMAASAMNVASHSRIRGSMLKTVTVSGGSIVADELVGAIDKVTVSGGNLRTGLIQSTKNLVLVQATSKKVNGVLKGGAVGTAGNAQALVLRAQPNVVKKTAIGKVYGQAGVSGYFYAGFDPVTGEPDKQGGIGTLQSKTGGVEGVAFLDPGLVAKMKILPKVPIQPIEINP